MTQLSLATKLLLLGFLLFGLIACGKKGGLYIPADESANLAAPQNPSVSQKISSQQLTTP